LIPIEWDARNPPSNPSGYALTVHTGCTVGLQNTLTALRLPVAVETLDPRYMAIKRPQTMRDLFDRKGRIAVPDEARHIEADLANLQTEIQKLDRTIPDAVPEFYIYSRETFRGLLEVVMVWGMVLSGQTAQGTLVGDWYFVVCRLDELEDVLTDVFQIERWCKLEEAAPRKAAPAKKQEVDKEAAKRAKIESVLRGMGI